MQDGRSPPESRRFEILRSIGSGGAGSVWLARDRYTGGKPIALKILDAEGPGARPLETLDTEFLALRELSHPGLVRVFERGILPETGEPFFTSEYVEGTDFLKATEGMAPDEMVELTIGILRTLEAIHRRGWVHCDLKPGNILVTPEHETRILDFGLAAREGDARAGDRIRGTFPYVAPETIDGEPVTRRVDLYALGVLLHEAVAGGLPTRGEDLLPQYRPEEISRLPAPFDLLLERLLRRDPAGRPASAEQCLELLAGALGREIPVETEESIRVQLEAGRFVGRERELKTLTEELANLTPGAGTDGRTGVVLIQGETGIGKRRLLREFRDRAQIEGVDFFSVTASKGEESAYAPLERAIRALLARVGAESECARAARPALTRILPELATKEDDGVEGAIGKAERLRWLEGLVRFVREASQGPRGFVLTFEELHRANFEIVEFFGYLARSLLMTGVRPPPVLLVASMGGGEEPPPDLAGILADLMTEGLLKPMTLERFDEQQVREFIRATLGLPEPPRRLVRMLHERTGGNVFFLEQLCSALVANGTVYYLGDRWRVGDISRIRVPESVAQVVSARLAELDGAEIATLMVAAAYGGPVPFALLERLIPEVRPATRRLLRRRVLMEEEDGEAVGFRHRVVAQLLLESADPKRLRAVHSRIGEALEAADLRVRPEKIAHHYSLGDDRRRALQHALITARRLFDEGKSDQAAIFYSRALTRLEREDPRRLNLLDALGDAHARAGRLELAVGTWRKALDEADERDFVAALHRKLGDALERTGTYEEALAHIRAGLEVLDPDDVDGRIPFLRLKGAVHRRLGDYPSAIESIREGLRLSRGEQSEETAALLNLLGNVYMLMGDHRKALNFHLRSLRFSQNLGFDAGAASALHNLGTLMNSWGAAERALRYYTDSLRLNERLLNLPAVALTYNNIANIHAETGDFDRAEYYHKRSLGIRRRIGDPFGIAMSFGNIGSMHRLRGNFGLAVAYYERAVRHFKRIGNEYGMAFFRTLLAELFVDVGDFDQALTLLEIVRDVAYRREFRRVLARAETVQGRMRRLGGDFDDALRGLTRAEEIDREVADRDGVIEALLETALVHAARNRRGQAYRAVSQALTEATATRSAASEARCLYVRASIGTRVGQEERERPRADLEKFLEFAGKVGRRDQVAKGLTLRARRALAFGDLEHAAEDVGEALRLTGEIGGSLPEGLATTYREDSRRGKLRNLGQRIRTELEEAGEKARAAKLVIDVDQMKPETLARLLEINKQLASETELSNLLELIMDTAVELTGAERGFLVLVEGNRVAAQVARNFHRREVEEPELKISQSIVRHVMKSGQPVLTDNATEDDRFSESKSVDNLKLTSILSVPFTSRGKPLGALYLDNQAKRGVFSDDDVETLAALSDQAAIAIQNLRHQLKLTERLQEQDTELQRVKQALDDRPYKYSYDQIIGSSIRMKEVFLLLDKVIDTEVPVLIQGESGTGKELVARAIHYKGPRQKREFVAVNTGAVPENLLESEFFGYVRGAFTGANTDKTGLFVQAHLGTLFLDEIGDMDFDMQKKLLRVLQQGEVRPIGGKKTVQVDVRIVCATNKDLRQRMLEHKFREDLFYRINVINVTLPPLRDRREDIPALLDHFINETAVEMGMAPKPIDSEAMEYLIAYSWPGNVRELENEAKKAMALSEEVILVDDLSPHILGDRAEPEPSLVTQQGTLKETMEATEKTIITKALEETGGNQTQAAKNLGISRVWLRKKMEKYGLLG